VLPESVLASDDGTEASGKVGSTAGGIRGRTSGSGGSLLVPSVSKQRPALQRSPGSQPPVNVHTQARVPGAQGGTPASGRSWAGAVFSSAQPDTCTVIGSKAQSGKANQVRAEHLGAIRRERSIHRD